MPGTLFVVATPIGNLEDITRRALRILGEVALVAAEDTRRSGNLLRHYGIDTPLISLHEHNEHQRRHQVVARLLAGESVALVSDAGTPGISDPGAGLVRAAREAGIKVEPIPGPSAVTAALSASGLASDRFVFAGFPPVRLKDRKQWLSWVATLSDLPVVCFEAPHRISRTLGELRLQLVNRPIMVARELTKAHEEWLDGEAEPQERGEFVIIIGQTTENAPTLDASVPVADDEIGRVFGRLTKSTTFSTRRAAVRAVAEHLGVPVKTVYEALERQKT
jgi:16S rRNA (cytidine1402-2'-O)-methyltransferase